MKQISIEFDGKKVSGAQGSTILEIARENDVFIPTLCHDEKLEPFGSCFLCVVEVEGARRLMPSCATKATDGMVIKSETSEIKENRRMCLELLLSDHTGDCLGPCTIECPGDLDPQGYIAHAAAGRFDEALKLIKSKLPLPASIGRVCPRPCETKCRRNAIGDPVAIDAIKRVIADKDLFSDAPWKPECAPSTGKTVAIVGAGPAGLTAAYFLALKGHKSVIYEMMPKPGGMFRYGIPEYRLPYDTLDKEIETITRLGVEIKYEKTLGKDFTLADLRKDYDAVFVATGAWKSSSMRCEGEDLEGVWGGIHFLRAVVEGKDTNPGDHVVVVGGGNTAVDAARTAWRLGSKVTIIYRRTRNEMPAHPDEIEASMHEEIDIQYLVAPKKVEKSDKGLVVHAYRMELGEPDDSGRRRPVPVDGSDFTIEASTVIAAIGQKVDLSWISKEDKLDQTRWGSILTNEATGTTSLDGVFSAGDCASGADIAIKAIGGARRAVDAMDCYLRGDKIEADVTELYNHSRGANEDLDVEELYKDVERTPREKQPEISLDARRMNNAEVDLTMSEEQLLREAARCLECGCQDIDECELRSHATRYGVPSIRFEGDTSQGAPDSSHPFVLREPSKCIKCGRCIRTCLEVQGVGAWGFVERGFVAAVEPTFRRPLQDTECESCGQCVSACPTGALLERVPGDKPGPFTYSEVKSTCTECGVGCSVKLQGVGSHLLKVIPCAQGEGSNAGNLCKKGRFDRVFDEADRQRLAQPMIRRNGSLVECSWDEAFNRAAELVKEAGTEGCGVFVSPHLTNEEAYTAGKLARGVIGTNNLGSLTRLHEGAFARALVNGLKPCDYEVIRHSDLVVFVDPETLERNGVIGNHVIAALNNGATLLSIGEAESKFDHFAGVKVDCMADEICSVLGRLASGLKGEDVTIPGLLDDERDVALALLNAAKRPVLIANRDVRSIGGLEALVAFKEALESNGAEADIVTLWTHANDLGLVYAGIDPKHLPGPCAVDSDKVGKYPAELLSSGAVKLALLVGEDPLGSKEIASSVRRNFENKVDAMVVVDSHVSETAKMAEVVLPAPARHEVKGTMTNSEGKVQLVEPLAPARSGRSTIEVLSAFAKALGKDELGACEEEKVFAELAGLVSDWKVQTYGEL